MEGRIQTIDKPATHKMVWSNNDQQQTIGTCFTFTDTKSCIFPLSASTWKLLKQLTLILIVVLIHVTGAGRDVGIFWSQPKWIYHQHLIFFYMLSIVTVRQSQKTHVAWCYVLAERMEIVMAWIAKTSKRKELASWTISMMIEIFLKNCLNCNDISIFSCCYFILFYLFLSIEEHFTTSYLSQNQGSKNLSMGEKIMHYCVNCNQWFVD